MTDWGLGRYELTASRLAPAAEAAVGALALTGGERIVDVGCGTGNAALAAARAGAVAIGVDTSERLVEVARERAAAEGLEATFEVADAVAIPAADATFDGAVSVFGVIFAEAEAAATELLRLVRPGGRIVLTTWRPDGATPKVLDAVREALGGPERPPVWSDPDVVRRLFAPHAVDFAAHELSFTDDSAAAYVAEQADHHPMWLAMAPALREAGRYEDVIARATAIYDQANEDPGGFRTTSRYHVVTVQR